MKFLQRKKVTVMRANLGDKVRDKVTGLSGIVIGRTEWLYGCVRCIVQPQELKDGRPVDNYQVDEPQLELIEAGAIPDVPMWREPAPKAEPRRAAGPRPDATRQRV